MTYILPYFHYNFLLFYDLGKLNHKIFNYNENMVKKKLFYYKNKIAGADREEANQDSE
jgi:hypothetical protein